MTIIAALIVLIAVYLWAANTLDNPGLQRRIRVCEDETFKRIEGKE